MQLRVDDTLLEICRRILAEGEDRIQWSESESDDQFHFGPYVSGFEATVEKLFFSYYDDNGR